MKKLLSIVTLLILSMSFIACDSTDLSGEWRTNEDFYEVLTFEKDGDLYKIESYKLHSDPNDSRKKSKGAITKAVSKLEKGSLSIYGTKVNYSKESDIIYYGSKEYYRLKGDDHNINGKWRTEEEIERKNVPHEIITIRIVGDSILVNIKEGMSMLNSGKEEYKGKDFTGTRIEGNRFELYNGALILDYNKELNKLSIKSEYGGKEYIRY